MNIFYIDTIKLRCNNNAFSAIIDDDEAYRSESGR